MIRPRTGLRVAAGVILAALLLGRWLAVSTVDRLWADAHGIGLSHQAIVHLRLALLGFAFGLASLWCGLNLYLVYRTIGSVQVPRRLANIEIFEAVPHRYLLYGTYALGLAIAVLVSHNAGDRWHQFALLGSQVTVGVQDPVLHRDLSYYLFRLPWQTELIHYLSLLATVMLAVIASLYGLVGAVRWSERRLQVTDAARVHLAGLLFVFGLTLVAGYRLDPAAYVAGLRDVPYDAILLDVRLPTARLLGAAALLVALTSLLWIWVDRAAAVLVPWAVFAGLVVVGTYLAPSFAAAVRRPDQVAAPPLIQAQRSLVRTAFGLPARDTVVDPPLEPAPDFLTRHAMDIARLPVWEPGVLTDVLNHVAGEHPYDRFAGLTLDAYPAPDHARQESVPVFVGVREVDLLAARQSDPALSWRTVHLGPYAFASGAVAVPAARVNDQGLPLFIPDLARPDSAGPTVETSVARREMRFTPSAEPYAVLPAGTTVDGIPPGGLTRRIALAWTLQTPKLLNANLVPATARIVWRRAVTDRLNQYAPFARFGSPSAIVVDHQVMWMAPGYVEARAFPLSVVMGWRDHEVRYLRAGLVGTVNAASGETRVYLTAHPDPLSAAWASLAPDIVKPNAALPASLARHQRYPEELFRLQLRIAERDTLNGLPFVPRAGGTPPPDGATPFWLVATRPGDQTPRLRLRAVAEQGDPPVITAVIDGVIRDGRQVLDVTRLAPPWVHPAASRLTTLNGESAAGIRPGPVETLLFAGGVMIARPVYQAPTSGDQAPRLREVAVRLGTARGRGATFAAALADLRAAIRAPGGSAEQWGQARQWFRRLDEARRRGDWSAFGTAYEALRRLLGAPPDTGQ